MELVGLCIWLGKVQALPPFPAQEQDSCRMWALLPMAPLKSASKTPREISLIKDQASK